jgi:hypothetical protein
MLFQLDFFFQKVSGNLRISREKHLRALSGEVIELIIFYVR